MSRIKKSDGTEEKVEFMKRFVLYKNEYLQIRIHKIPNPEETFIHNHSTSFFSYCFNGSYFHRIWVD